MVPTFLYSLYLTLYKTDIALRWTLTAGPKGVRLRGRFAKNVKCKGNFPGVDLLGTALKFRKRKKNSSSLVYVLHEMGS